MPGYVDMVEELTSRFPLTEPRIVGEQNQKDFISLFGAFLRMRNLLLSFDEFQGKEILSERDLQDYLGRYQDLRDEWRQKRPGGEKEDITDDIVFETELVRQIEINIDYILLLVKKFHDSHGNDTRTLHSGNLYQIFTYVKNKEAELADVPHEVSGMLLYARTDESVQPSGTYKMSGNQISVKTLDLNCEFAVIAQQLNRIVQEHFGL